MEIKVDDMTIGYQTKISFSNLRDYNNSHVSTFKKMATQDGSSYVIIYQWVDSMSKTYYDREEAFYIDNINENNREEATRIFNEVFEELQKAFMEDSNQVYDLTNFINSVVSEKNKTR